MNNIFCFRKSVKTDITRIMDIIKQSQDYFKENDINQWQNNYPNIDTISDDISKGNSYVLLKDGHIIGTVAAIFDKEKTYEVINHGKWLSGGRYAVIHRIAVDISHKGTGISAVILKNIEKMCNDKDFSSIRVDTHRENKAMKQFLKKNDFHYCGIIYLEDGSEREAFEKLSP